MHKISLFSSPNHKVREIPEYQDFELTTYLSLIPDQLQFTTSTSEFLPDLLRVGKFIEVQDGTKAVIFKGRIKEVAPHFTQKNKTCWSVEAVGLEAGLHSCRVQTTLINMSISEMIMTILDNAATDITYAPNSIEETYPKLSLTFDQTPARALNLLCELAGDYSLYVNDGILHFHSALTKPNKLWNFTTQKTLSITQNSKNIINSVNIHGARLANQTYLVFNKDHLQSIKQYGKQEKRVLARNIDNSTLAEKLADLILERYASPHWEGYFVTKVGAYQLGDIVKIQGSVLPKSETINLIINKIVHTALQREIHFSQGKGELSELIEAFTTSEETLEFITISLNEAVNRRVRQFTISGLQFLKNYYSPTSSYQEGSLSYSAGYLYLADEPFPWYLGVENIQPLSTPPLLKDLDGHCLLYARLEIDSASSDVNGIVSHHSGNNKIYATTALSAPPDDDSFYYVEVGRWDNSVTPGRLTLLNGGETTIYGDDLKVGTLNADLVNIESTAGSDAVHVGDINSDKGAGNRIILGNWVAQTGGIGANSGLLCKHTNGDYTILNSSGLLLKSGSTNRRYLYNSMSAVLGWITDTSEDPDSETNDPTGLDITIRATQITVPDTSIKTTNEWKSSITVSPLKLHPYQAGSNRTTNLTLLNHDKSAWVTVTPSDLEYVQEAYTSVWVDDCEIIDSNTLKFYIGGGIQYALDNHPTDGICYWGVGLDGGVREVIWFLVL